MIAHEFDDWQESPPPALHDSCSPNLMLVLQEMKRRWPAFTSLGCFGRRAVRGGVKPSTHWHGAAIDIGYPPEMDYLVGTDVVVWLVARSHELHVQAIHDYRRCRIWRAARTALEADCCTAWWKSQRRSQLTGMGQPWCNHLHVEVTASGWGDTTPVDLRWTE